MFVSASQDMKAIRSGKNDIWAFVAQWVFFNSLLCFVAALLFTNMDNFWS